ncbi:MAG: TlpA family protein disulfide reductase [Crocinitomicaceae bacterium]
MKGFILIGLVLLTACSSPAIEEEIIRAPIQVIEEGDIKVEVYDFETIQPFLERKNDKINVVNFWATWCLPCVAELPHFEKILAEDAEVTVTLISLDFVKQVPTSLIPFIRENDLKSDVIVLDDPNSNEWIPKIDKNWSGALPATIIYNQDKSVFYERSFTFEELKTEVQKFKN